MRISDWSSDVCSSDLRKCSSSTWGTAMPESRNRQSQTAVLQIRDLHVYYGRSHALQGVELTLERGVHAVVGRNGMGKTTLCNAIMGLVPVQRGSIRFAGVAIAGLRSEGHTSELKAAM